MHVDLFMLVFLSLPEFLLNLSLMLIISGAKEKLKLKTPSNAIRFFSAVAFMLTATWLIRPHVSNVPQSLICHSIAYILIIFVLYRIPPVKLVLGVAWTILYQSTLENTFIPFVVAYISKGLTAFYGSYITLALVSLPVRIFQLLAVIYIYKNEKFLDVVWSEKKYNITFMVSCFLMAIAEVFISYTYLMFFDKFPFTIQLLYSCALLILTISFYVAIFGFIYLTVRNFVKDVKYRETKQKQQSAINLKKVTDKNHKTLEELYHVLENERNVDKAIGLLKEHLHKPELQDARKS